MPDEDQIITQEAGQAAEDGAAGQVQGQAQQQEPDWRAEAERWRKEHQRLERKYTKESQRWAQYKDAVALWDFLSQNQELSQQVQALIDAYDGDQTQATLMQHLQQFESRLQQQLALKEAEVALRQDPVFRENESEIRDWAEAEGFDLSDPGQLRNAYRAWKGEHADKLLAEAKVNALKAAAKAPAERRAAELTGAGMGGKREPNWREMSDKEILATLGLNLFEDT